MGRVTEPGGEAGGEAPEAYYLPGLDGAFTPTLATESPWSADAQHGGPPCALFAHVMRIRHPEPGFRVARLTVEFLGTVPRSDVEVSTEIIRDGRRSGFRSSPGSARSTRWTGSWWSRTPRTASARRWIPATGCSFPRR